MTRSGVRPAAGSSGLPIDLAWRRFRREAAPYLAACEALVPLGWETLRGQGLTGGDARRVGPWVPLPGLVTWNLEDVLARGEAPAGAPAAAGAAALVQRVHQTAPLGLLAATTSALAAWRLDKRVYCISPALAAGLRRARWPGTYPAAHVLLPAPAIALEVPADADEGTAAETLVLSLDLATRREAAGALELRIARLPALAAAPPDAVPVLEPVAIATLGVPGDGTTLDQALGTARAAVRRSVAEYLDRDPAAAIDPAPLDDGDASWTGANPTLRLAINAALYLLGDDDVVAQVGTVRAPREADGLRRDPRLRDLAPPQVWDVGVRYAAAIARQLRDLEAPGAGRDARDPDAAPTGRLVRPHLRAAHAHLYWVGAGRQTPRVRYLPPILVKGGPAAEAPVPTVRHVR